jgi:hypothetical protein
VRYLIRERREGLLRHVHLLLSLKGTEVTSFKQMC